MKNNIKNVIEELLLYATDNLDMFYEDCIYKRNELLDLFKLDSPSDEAVTSHRPIQQILDEAVDYAIKNKICNSDEALRFETRIMGILTPSPYQVITEFENLCMNGTDIACKYLYDLSVNSNYIRKADIDKNIQWKAENPRGDILITINLAKPEKDPKTILAEKNAPATNYPKCALCVENVGFAGSATRVARQTLRTIPLELNGENWHFQYSPYVYFDQHCIVLSEEHRPMAITLDTFRRMLDFLELFPDYFIGSNAALPIVGGSILSHDHYQGGAKVLPEMFAKSRKQYTNTLFPDVKISIVDWYNSVVRLESSNRDDLLTATEHIVKMWNDYSDKSVNIIAKDKEQHNAVTPIARLNDNNEYVIDLILRNNRTDKVHPYGIFHPAEDLHNIKKEGIGIIEVMGLFILPGRLANEALIIRDYLNGKNTLNFKELANPENPISKHLGMIAQLANDYGTNLSDEETEKHITDYINNACVKILDTTAVFKNDEAGQTAFDKFMRFSGNEII